MNISLIDRKALVGGSTAGIGKGIALQLASSGASVTLMARNEEKLNNTLKELDISKGQIHQILVVDFDNANEVRDKIDHYFATNKVDILVNNTNGPSAGTVMQKELADYQKAFDLLFQNNLYITQKALPHMQSQKFGRIINVSSSSVKEPIINLVLSNTMRTAWAMWNKSLAQEVAKDNITVNTILTGLFDTDRIKDLNQFEADKTGKPFEEVSEARTSQIPAKRLGKPEEYGYLVTFLASEYASYLTGANITLDGGSARAF
jgi:3-oxoacyl-[acyl-carrier protein] reductase